MEIGTRVRIVKDVDVFPTIFLKAGETGTLAEIGSEGQYYVKLDLPHSELNEWDNCIELWDWSKDNGNDPELTPESYLQAI
jgi:hypothetical protein